MALELITKISQPVLYLDLDGVLADLYGYAAEIHDVDHYNQMTDDQWETFFRNTDAYHLFRSLNIFSTNEQLLAIIKQYAGKYTILSSPLNFDPKGSIRGKREWIKNNIIRNKPDNIIFEHQKEKYAVQPDGTPNILIDDFGPNIEKWNSAGGIGIKYQADEDSLNVVIDGLKRRSQR